MRPKLSMRSGTGLASATVDISTDGGSSWAPAIGTPTTTKLLTTMPSTGSVQFRVRVTDLAGNVGTERWSDARTGRLVQQSAKAVKYKGTWTTSKSSRYSGGSARYAKAKGASASYTFTGRSIALSPPTPRAGARRRST